MVTSKAVLKMAAAIARSLEQEYNLYIEACEADRREGFRPHYCEHGTNLWTDYDNICGGCEDGVTMADGVQRRQYALDSARRRDEKCKEIVRAASVLREAGIDLDWEPVWAEVTRLLTV